MAISESIFSADSRAAVSLLHLLRSNVEKLDKMLLSALSTDDSHLAGMLSVRSIKGDGAYRIAAKAQFALLVQPLPWLPTQLHQDLWCVYRPTTCRFRIIHLRSQLTRHLPSTAS
jgi:hypothetical protein